MHISIEEETKADHSEKGTDDLQALETPSNPARSASMVAEL
jgi:hypothetical protein